MCWVAENAARFGVDRNKIVLAGDSAGGNLTIVTCLIARERGGPSIRFQVPIYPSLDLRPRPQYESRPRLGAGGYILTNDDIEWMLDHYLNARSEGTDWRASPIVAKSYVGLPGNCSASTYRRATSARATPATSPQSIDPRQT